MYKFGHKHESRGFDFGFNGVRIPGLQMYDVVAWRRWIDFFMFRFGLGLTSVLVSHNCRYTTVKLYPYQSDQAIITVDGRDLFEILDQLGTKGRVKIHAAIPLHGIIGGMEYLTDAECKLVLGFTHKKSAMMAKLALAGS